VESLRFITLMAIVSLFRKAVAGPFPGFHVGVQGDLIYFLDECIINHVSYTCVHNMTDGTLRRFAAGLPLPKSGVPKESCSDFPVWMFPS